MEEWTSPVLFGCFRRHPVDKVYGSSILRVASQFHTVNALDLIETVASDFAIAPEVLALGVLDESGRLIGLIDRAHFFSELARPFGRDILVKKPVLTLTEEVPVFFYNKNVFSVAADLDNPGQPNDRVCYYGLVDEQGRFAGLFSSMDLLRYLSGITQQDISLAGQLQDRLVKDKQVVQEKSFRFYGFSQYAKGMGGDFYGLYPVRDKLWFFTMCDVSGKGVAASVITSMLWGMFRMYDWRQGLKHLILEINKALIQTFHMENYVTGIFGLYDAKSGRISLADMGHSMSYVIRNGKITHIHGSHLNLPVGIDLALDPSIIRLKLIPGDILVFMTDGLVEQENAAGQTRDALQWIRELLPVIDSNSDPREAMLGMFNDYRKGIPQQDDLTAMFLQIDV